MRKTLLTTAALCGAAFAMPAFAQPDAQPDAQTDGTMLGSNTAPASAPAPHHMRPHHRGTNAAAAPMSDTGARPGHEPGVGESFPTSNNASNINPSDSRGQVAPRLPAPPSGSGSTPQAFLQDAQRALSQRRTGTAQEALERAETAYLNNPANPADPTSGPVGGQAQQTTAQARQALGRGDISQALGQLGAGQGRSMNAPTMGGPGRGSQTGM